MKNPLMKRLPREFREDLGKYLAIFLFLVVMIGFVSGSVIAEDSMMRTYDETFEKYSIEDGHFSVAAKLSDELWESIEEENVTLYENFYIQSDAYKDGAKESFSSLRVYGERSQVNRTDMLAGEMPGADDEIAIDRVYAKNNDLSIGDAITYCGRTFTITGFVALPDYSCLFENNSDSMFEATKFGVGIVTKDCFSSLPEENLTCNYAFVYDNGPTTDEEKKEESDDFSKELATKIAMAGNELTDYVPEYLNQAIHFTREDMGSDRSMFLVLLYIMIVIVAFLFAVTTNNTIAKEAPVIGTLRAMGYTKGEIVRHYMAMPLLVTLLAAVVGNVLGYTYFEDFFQQIVAGSYSLMPYVSYANRGAFLNTTVIPVVLVTVVVFIAVRRKLNLSPLRFLRRDLAKRQRKKAMRLPRWGFFHRFRLRILLQNLPGYVTLFIGLAFADLLLLFGLAFSPLLEHYEQNILDHPICAYQYVLKAPVEIEADAEKFAMKSLKTTFEGSKEEDISVYGIEDSQYVPVDFSDGKVYVSDGICDKYGLSVGDRLTLKDGYASDTYTFTIAGVYDYPASLAVFMNLSDWNELFDQKADYFSGYFSDEKLDELTDEEIYTTITQDDLTKITRQLTNSMGNIFYAWDVVSVALYLVIIYVLTKVVVEKNVTSISMVKILGYENREIKRLYLTATTIAVVVLQLIAIPLSNVVLELIYRPMVRESMSGWLPYYVEKATFLKMFAICMVAYLLLEQLIYRKIRAIPMDEALKNVE